MSKILIYANEKQIEITIGNGTNFNDVSNEILELLVKTQVKFINISLDGASQEIYSIYRQKGNFDKVINNIKKLNEYKKKYNSKYPELQWQYIIMEHNLKELKRAKNMAKELDMKISYTYDCIKNNFAIAESDRERIKEITGLEYLTQTEYNEANDEHIYGDYYCYQMLYSPQINFDGRLLGCCLVWDEDYGINCFEEGLVNALNCEKYLSTIKILMGLKKMKNWIIHVLGVVWE